MEERCPHCEGDEFKRYGFYKGNQRYKCKKCNRIFTIRTDSFYHCSKKFEGNVKIYIRLMYEGKTLREIARAMEITVVTAFLWRHKIMKVLHDSNENNLLVGSCEGFDYITRGNLKGVKGGSPFKGRVQIIIAFDDKNRGRANIITKEVVGLRITKEKMLRMLHKDASIFIGYNNFMRIAGEQINKGKKNENKERHKNKLVIIRIHRWINKFRGVSTKYVEKYLSWFILDYKLDKI
ncbi:MAG: transposase [Clostridium sp.]|uniref:transposase n=1 Tax=Clostridium sp. TaxID=1506 RepID=UPI003F332F52